ncbi:hypothetical protein TWF281_011679 [Arthrobotrys megalospora]
MQQPNTPPPPKYRIIPATPSHIPQITAVVNHYILHTATNFSYRPLQNSYYEHTLTDNYSHRRLPFLVAIEDTEEKDNEEGGEIKGKVIGFTTVTPWTPSKLGYAHTLEVSLYISPTQRGGGIGTALLTALITHLENNEYLTFSERGAISSSFALPSNAVPDGPGVVYGIPVKCTQLLALMAVDEDTTLDGQVWRFYERRGFELMGVMKGGWVEVWEEEGCEDVG